MTTLSEKRTAYLRLARLSNLPTVFSNVLVGAALAAGAGPLNWPMTLVAMAAASLFYVGGMALNDLMDRDIDAVERPQRPIPSGALSVKEATRFTFICFGSGLILTLVFAPGARYFALALIGAIVAYDVLHKRWNPSLIFMGLCRTLVYALAAAICTGPEARLDSIAGVLLLGGLLALYIIGLTVVAQKEATGGLGFRRWLAIAMVFLPFIAVLFVAGGDWRWALAAGCALLLWLIRSAYFVWQTPPKVVPAILGWLAGICLIDALFLSFTHYPQLALAAWLCFGVTIWGHRRIAGT